MRFGQNEVLMKANCSICLNMRCDEFILDDNLYFERSPHIADNEMKQNLAQLFLGLQENDM